MQLDRESGRGLQGETTGEVRERAYDRLDDVSVPNTYYRDDIGDHWIEDDGDRLQARSSLGP